MRGVYWSAWPAVVLAGILGAARAAGYEGPLFIDAELAEQRARLDAEQAERVALLEGLEARLLSAQADRARWAELGARHGEVSALACENAAGHVAAIEAYTRRQEQRAARARRMAALDSSHHGSGGTLTQNARARDAP